MWFLPLRQSVRPGEGGILHLSYERWFVRFVEKLLSGDADIRKLLRKDPFGGRPPRFLRAHVYRYQLATPAEHRQTGAHWKRTPIGEYLPLLERPAKAQEHPAAEERPPATGLEPVTLSI